MRYALFPSDFGIHKWGGKLKFIILCYFNSKNFSMIIPYNFLLLSVITLQRIPIHRSFIFNRKWRSDILSSLYDQWFFSMSDHTLIAAYATSIYILCMEEGYAPSLWLNMRYTLLSSETAIHKNLSMQKNCRLHGYYLQ